MSFLWWNVPLFHVFELPLCNCFLFLVILLCYFASLCLVTKFLCHLSICITGFIFKIHLKSFWFLLYRCVIFNRKFHILDVRLWAWTLFKVSHYPPFSDTALLQEVGASPLYLEGEEVHLLYLACIDLEESSLILCVCDESTYSSVMRLLSPFRGWISQSLHMFISDFTLACMVGTLYILLR